MREQHPSFTREKSHPTHQHQPCPIHQTLLSSHGLPLTPLMELPHLGEACLAINAPDGASSPRRGVSARNAHPAQWVAPTAPAPESTLKAESSQAPVQNQPPNRKRGLPRQIRGNTRSTGCPA